MPGCIPGQEVYSTRYVPNDKIVRAGTCLTCRSYVDSVDSLTVESSMIATARRSARFARDRRILAPAVTRVGG